jgi:hypothetical protein
MSTFKTAYDVTACSGYRIKEIEDKMKIAMVSSSLRSSHINLDNFEDNFNIWLVEGGNSKADVIPYFNHPLLYKDLSASKSLNNVVIDVRNFGKWYAPQDKFVVKNLPEFNWNVLRGALNHLWVNERVEIFRDVSILPVSVYGALISECVSRKFALDPGEQIIISIISSFYYYCLFTDEKTFNDTEMNKIAANIARATRTPADKVFNIIGDMKVLNSLDELCIAFKEKTNSIRLNDFNIGVLLAVVSGNWFGSNARENLAVGLEHIPTWLMICYAALDEATFKRSVLAKLVERFAKGGAGDNYIKSINSLLDKKSLLLKVANVD